MTWDPSFPEPSLVVAKLVPARHGRPAHTAILRLLMDGRRKLITREDGEGPWLSPEAHGMRMAVLPGGDIAVTDWKAHRIYRVTRAGAITPLAGTGREGSSGDVDDQGRPRPALETDLNGPYGIAVSPDGEVVFTDCGVGLVRRFRPGGPIVTLAGSGADAFRVTDHNDLDRRYPALAASLGQPIDVAIHRDGRIVILVYGQPDMNPALGTLLVLHPDGTLRNAFPEGPGAMLPVAGNGVMAINAKDELIFWGAPRPGSRGGLCMLPADGRPVRLTSPDEHVTHFKERLLASAEDTFLKRPAMIAAWPGGGVLLQSDKHNQILQVGPAKADHLLAEQVAEAFHAAGEGDFARTARVRAGLVKWANAQPEAARGLPLQAIQRGGMQLPVAAPLARLIGSHLPTPDAEGLRVRARTALWVLDHKLASEAKLEEGFKAYREQQKEAASQHAAGSKPAVKHPSEGP
jgi:hypothetical protein